MKKRKEKIQLSADQQQALDLMLSGANVFLTGKAGTGKSTVLKEFRRLNDKPAVYVAPTGIAALNIEGQTIHSCFQIKPGIMSDVEPMTSKKRYEVLRRTQVIVIDEISMVRSDLLTAVDVRMRQIAYGLDQDKPFGGRQLIVVGDFLQLSPVVERESTHSYLCMRYGGIYAFQSASWITAGFTPAVLSTMHRQSDSEFIDVLNRVRSGDSDVVDELNAHRDYEVSDKAITLSPYRYGADSINSTKLAEIDDDPHRYTGTVTGRFTNDLPVDETIELKVGARVMFAANKYTKDGDLVFCNGELGVVRALKQGSVTVTKDDGDTLTVFPYEWDMYEYDYSGTKVESKIVGTYTQIPLRLAWAVTIHKSQGCTFDDVILDVGRGCFAEGQLYTALSRVKTLRGLKLAKKLRKTDVRVSRDIVDLYATFNEGE